MERRVEWANIDNPFLISPAINLPYYSHLPNTETGTCRFKYILLQRKTSLYIVTSNEALKRIFHSAVCYDLGCLQDIKKTARFDNNISIYISTIQ